MMDTLITVTYYRVAHTPAAAQAHQKMNKTI